jgi:hypothetical protein
MPFDPKTKRYTGTNTELLAYLAVVVAVEAPERANRWASCAKIPWPVVESIRHALNGTGLDWRKAVRGRLVLQREEKRKQREARTQ